MKGWKAEQHNLKTSSDIQQAIKKIPEIAIGQLNLNLAQLDKYLSEHETSMLFIYGCGNDANVVEDIAKLKNKYAKVKVVVHLHAPESTLLLKCIDLKLNDIITLDDTHTIIKKINDFKIAQEHFLKNKPHNRKVFGFMSSKGGDGATVIATNFASALSRNSMRRVLIIDMAIPFGDADMYLTQKQNVFDLTDFVNAYDRLDEVLIESMVQRLNTNLHFIPSTKDFQKIMSMKTENYEHAIEKLKNFYDYIVLDFSSNFDPINLNIIRSCEHIFMVLSDNLASIRLCTQKLNILEQNKVNLEKVVLIENESGMNNDISTGDIEVALDKKVDLFVPYDNDIIKESLIQSKAAIKINSSNKLSKKIIGFSHQWLGNHGHEPAQKPIWRHFFRTKLN